MSPQNPRDNIEARPRVIPCLESEIHALGSFFRLDSLTTKSVEEGTDFRFELRPLSLDLDSDRSSRPRPQSG